MAKQDNVQNFVPQQQTMPQPVAYQEEAVFESEAYGSPQPDAGMGTTVCKPVGIGGPIPIVAPRRTTIQLQPIIVPMAVVPYMSQDNDVLKVDGVQQPAEQQAPVATTDFSRVEEEKKAVTSKKKSKKSARIASAVLFILSSLVMLAYTIASCYPTLWNINWSQVNMISQIINWIGEVAPTNIAITILHVACYTFASIVSLMCFICFFVGKLPAGATSVLAFISAATVDAALIYDAVMAHKAGIEFVATDYVAYIIVASLATLTFIVSAVIAVCLNRKKDIYNLEQINAEENII